jgi:hypothetical protein
VAAKGGDEMAMALAIILVLAVSAVIWRLRCEVRQVRKQLAAARYARHAHWQRCVEQHAEKDALRVQLQAANRKVETLRLQFCDSISNQTVLLRERDEARKEVCFLERDNALQQAYCDQLKDIQTCPECHEVDRSSGWFEPAAPNVVSLKIVN